MSPVRLPILTPEITVDLQLLQEVWNKLSNQMSEMSETNELLKRAVKTDTRNSLIFQNNPLRKLPMLQKQTSQIKTAKTLTRFLKVKL